MTRKPFVYQGYRQIAAEDVAAEGDGSLPMYWVSGPVHGRQIGVKGQALGAESLAMVIAALLTNCTKVYEGLRRPGTARDGVYVQVQFSGLILHTYRLVNCDADGSPAGFSWGYAGSGPAALAWSLLEDHLADHVKAERLHQSFKSAIVEHWQGDNWRITSGQIEDWIFRHEERMAMAQLDAAAIRQEVGRP